MHGNIIAYVIFFQKLYLVGSNNRETRFRVLEIDRTHPTNLIIHENVNEIEVKDIRRLVGQIPYTRKISAYGILGFVRFLEGYYLILITKRTRCAVIGMHLIYTIKDTVMIRVNDSTSLKQAHPLEQRYLKMFQNIDLKSNFYFSYSYDLTRTLQYNMSAPRFIGSNINLEFDEPLPNWTDVIIFRDFHSIKIILLKFIKCFRNHAIIQRKSVNMHSVVYHVNVLYGMHFY